MYILNLRQQETITFFSLVYHRWFSDVLKILWTYLTSYPFVSIHGLANSFLRRSDDKEPWLLPDHLDVSLGYLASTSFARSLARWASATPDWGERGHRIANSCNVIEDWWWRGRWQFPHWPPAYPMSYCLLSFTIGCTLWLTPAAVDPPMGLMYDLSYNPILPYSPLAGYFH